MLEGTTVTWKQGEEPDPKTPGTTDSHVIVTIPGQDPVEISTKVTITAKTSTDTSDDDKPPVIPPAPEGHKPEETKPPKKEPEVKKPQKKHIKKDDTKKAIIKKTVKNVTKKAAKTENPWATNSGVHGEGLDAREKKGYNSNAGVYGESMNNGFTTNTGAKGANVNGTNAVAAGDKENAKTLPQTGEKDDKTGLLGLSAMALGAAVALFGEVVDRKRKRQYLIQTHKID